MKSDGRLRRSPTWDRGKEMAAHRAFAVAKNAQVYFCDPRSPWQRGSNENANGYSGDTSQKEPIYRSYPKSAL